MKNLLLPLYVVLGMALVCFSAPAPFPKDKPGSPRPTEIQGEWSLKYEGEDFQAKFHPGGKCTCLWRGGEWQGRWAVAGEHVSVQEWITSPTWSLHWRVKVTRHRCSGKIKREGKCEKEKGR